MNPERGENRGPAVALDQVPLGPEGDAREKAPLFGATADLGPVLPALRVGPEDLDQLEGFALLAHEVSQNPFVVALEHEKPIERFNTTAGLVLASTYESFPSDHGFTVDYEANEHAAVLVKDTIKWLAAEGYLRMDRHGDNHFRATLSAKGLAVLTTTPSSLSPAKESIGETMLKEARKGGKEAMGALAKEALVAGARLLASAAMRHAGVDL